MHPFIRSGDAHGNVVVNFRRDPVGDFVAFATGHHNAGRRLVRQLEKSNGYADYDGYPIVFLYRHSLELYLKAIVLTGAKLMKLEGLRFDEPPLLLKRHGLAKLLDAVKAIFEGAGWTGSFGVPRVDNYDELRNLLSSFDEIDEDSYAFRYPINKAKEAILPQHFILNVIDLAKGMDPLLEFLDRAASGLEDQFQSSAEIKWTVRQLLDEL